MTKNQFGKEEFISPLLPHCSPLLKGGGKEPGSMNSCNSPGRVFLSGLFLVACSVCFFIYFRDHLHRNSIIHKWDGPFYVNHQSRRCTTALPTGQSSGGIFSIEVSPFPDESSLCQVESKNQTGHHERLESYVYPQHPPESRRKDLTLESCLTFI